MTEKFRKAIAVIITVHEGGFQKRADDPGNYRDGILVGTKYGISAKSFPHVDIENLTVPQTEELYFSVYGRFDLLQDQRVLTKVLDLAVNMQWAGHGAATQILQEAINDCGVECAVDSSFGSVTADAANSVEPNELLEAIGLRALEHYQKIEDRNPEQQAWFKNWEHRASWLPPDAETSAASA